VKISVVLAYYNRRALLEKTLESISCTKHPDFEVIVVDDASIEAHRVEQLQATFSFLKVHRVVPDKKTWRNPCVPNNIGFGLASGDVVVIQNPECLHLGDILTDVANTWVTNDYLVYGCYALDTHKTNLLQAVPSNDIEALRNIILPTNDLPLDQCPHKNRWYQHSVYSPRCFNFCTAIGKVDLGALGGFDDAFAKGIGYDDTEFIARIKKKGMNVRMIDSPMVIHQWHPYTNYSGKNWDLHMKNKTLYETKTSVLDTFYVANPLSSRYLKEIV
jgi:glycosyltransferase involved in cell wall biosynthesis